MFLPSNLEVQGLRKSFGAAEILRGVDLLCRGGAVHGLVGRNGSGKTTLLNCLSSRTSADEGRVLLGERPLSNEPSWRRALGGFAWTLQDPSLSLTLSLAEILRVVRSRDGGGPGARPTYLEAATARFEGLAWNTLSFGQRKLAALRVALSRRPRVLLLDEPVSGLSPDLVEVVALTLKSFAAQGAVVLVVEHDREFLANAAHAVSVLEQGVILLTSDPISVFEDSRTLAALL